MKIFILSLGCAKNRVDSECLAGELCRAGHILVADAEEAEAAIINTCGFIQPAVEENIAAILDLEELKASGRLKKTGVVGCLFNRYGAELAAGFKTVDFWAESEAWDKVLEALGSRTSASRTRANLPDSPFFTRYLKISEGCDNRCTYCAIPSIRGKLRSLPAETIVNEAVKLAEDGARELCVVGQDLTVYGMDFAGKSKLTELLDALESNLPDSVRLRLLYLHPDRVTPKLLERVVFGKKILNYLDIPVQHADEEILAAMNRGITRKRLENIFACARSLDPDFALRTTCMVGFPGETARSFGHLLDFLEKVQFDRVGAFTYFAEEGTEAASMPKQVRNSTKERRLAKLMERQEEISFSRQQRFVGRTLDVLVEKIDGCYAEGRSFREAPEVDGIIEIDGVKIGVKAGDVIKAKIKEALPHDLMGEAR
ncbi:MAG: 30S ribosomal protein S12 methylthiotransferase RimO [Synergistaceae bacterium]|nr:30S ribosomal protein S12 methylthiotransferase RimO [Synergistaceae bacterium]